MPAFTTAGVRIHVDAVGVHRRGRSLLRDATFVVEAGEVVAIVGASGAGKTTLLRAMAGVAPATTGTVRFEAIGVPTDAGPAGQPSRVGFVPQDDIIHRELPLDATLRYAARLRLPHHSSPSVVERAVDVALADLDLADQRDVRVGDLSGGQRKRASIAVELLTRPHAFFLDEPTSGLDPATAARLMATLRRLAAKGTTVVLTTHSTDDLRSCDRLVVVGGGTVRFVGPVAQALAHFGVDHVADVYLRADLGAPWAAPPAAQSVQSVAARSAGRSDVGPGASRGAVVQWAVLARRDVDILRRNRLTLAIMLGAPVLVVAMFAVLFRGHALDTHRPDAAAAISTTYWMVFAAFFFGLTYGLLQICTEISVVRRERFVGVRGGPYLAAKVSVLAPVVVAADAVMVVVLRTLDRLPPGGPGAYGRLLVSLVLTSVAALALGLLASAAVADVAQAALALPMLCFPAVLFAGAVVPVPTMASAGRAISTIVVARWAFEAAGRDLALGSLLAADHDGPGRALLADYGATFTGTGAAHWAILAGSAAVFLVGAARVLRRRTAAA